MKLTQLVSVIDTPPAQHDASDQNEEVKQEEEELENESEHTS